MSEFPADDQIRLQREVVNEHLRAENAHEPAVYDTFLDSVAFLDFVPFS